MFKEGKGLEKRTRDNALFLSVVANFNGEITQDIFDWFKSFRYVSGASNNVLTYTKQKINEDSSLKEKVLEFLKVVDVNIEDFSFRDIKIPEENFPKEMPESLRKFIARDLSIIFTHHKVFNSGNELSGTAHFNLEGSESQGTIKLLSLSVPLIETLENGGILVVDELDAKFHPLITRFIIQLFHSEKNKRNAQLIFNTHDTTHLNKKYYRRDQIWFTEKDRYGCTHLYSLVEYRLDESKVRNDASYSKDYIQGRYGAVPYIGNFEFLGETDGDGQSFSQKEEGNISEEDE